MRKLNKLQLFRYFSQAIFLIFLPGLFTLIFSELKQIYGVVLTGNFNFLKILPNMIEVIAIIPITILLGRIFCGWFCAFGTLSDLIYLISSKLFNIKFEVNEKLDSVLKYTKYLILMFIVIVIWTKKSTLFESSSPWDAFAQITNLPKGFFQYRVAFLVLAFIGIGAMFVERFFCRYLCPLGGFFNAMTLGKTLNINKPCDKCGSCRICTNNCSMGIKLYNTNKVKSLECINCYKCIASCPRKNVRLNIGNKNLSPLVVSLIAIIVFEGIYHANFFIYALNGHKINIASFNNTYKTSVAAKSSKLKKYYDGTYTGTGNGYRPNIRVSVTIKNDKIIHIQIVSDNETPRFRYRPFSVIPEEIIKAQALKVDTISGATMSCDGVIMAVKNAINKALVNKTH